MHCKGKFKRVGEQKKLLKQREGDVKKRRLSKGGEGGALTPVSSFLGRKKEKQKKETSISSEKRKKGGWECKKLINFKTSRY